MQQSATEACRERREGESHGRVRGIIAHGWRRFPRILYVLLVLALPAATVLVTQFSLYTQDAMGNVRTFISKVWNEQQYQIVLNYLIVLIAYLLVVFLINRFWIATAVFAVVSVVLATANYFKVSLRNEPVIPTDLNFLGNSGQILSFIPADGMQLLYTAIGVVAGTVIVCALCHVLDARRTLITMTRKDRDAAEEYDGNRLARWLRRLSPRGCIIRLLLVVTPLTALACFTWNLGVAGSWAKVLAAKFSDAPVLFSAIQDMQQNGYVVGFLRNVHVRAMEKPDGYSRESMERIAQEYAQDAERINLTRETDLEDNTVIMILSESFSDPARVPDVALSGDPIASIRQIKDETTSGLTLSTGYGGGTANIEYQALTGLSLANFDSSLSVAYQQLVPSQKWTPSFNQLWNTESGTAGSEAFHSYNRSMYFRGTNYAKFGFSTFWAEDGTNQLTHTDTIEDNPYISDAELYQSILDSVEADGTASSFVQAVTMQNHMPYYDWYADNEFKDDDQSAYANDYERQDVETYAKGLQFTDQATKEFLDELDELDKPVTVIFYGDHLPGIYTHMTDRKEGSLYVTDYFIWSNAASTAAATKLDVPGVQVTSSNYFMALAAQHMNAKVTPYLAFLTELRETIAAIGPAGVAIDGEYDGNPVYLDADGERITQDALTDEQRKLLDDYTLIQYDVTVGKGYLKELDFME